jgi:hypothetical protein
MVYWWVFIRGNRGVWGLIWRGVYEGLLSFGDLTLVDILLLSDLFGIILRFYWNYVILYNKLINLGFFKDLIERDEIKFINGFGK